VTQKIEGKNKNSNPAANQFPLNIPTNNVLGSKIEKRFPIAYSKKI